jgi:hypothetical protein
VVRFIEMDSFLTSWPLCLFREAEVRTAVRFGWTELVCTAHSSAGFLTQTAVPLQRLVKHVGSDDPRSSKAQQGQFRQKTLSNLHFIDNKFVPASSGDTFPIIDPSTEKESCQVAKVPRRM